MGHATAAVRLRPVRMAFLVRPSDHQRLLEIFRINTSLWGGKFNPIVPYFQKVPTWWERHHRPFETARQIVHGYLDRYEPDYIVEAEHGLSAGLGFDEERTLQLSEVLVRDGDRDKRGCGLNVLDLYRELYLKEFQFERRHKHDIVHVEAADKRFETFASCVFGGFPRQKALSYIGRAFKDAFSPTTIALDGSKLAELYKKRYTSALTIGHERIDVDYRRGMGETTLFIMNALETRDLIDYWNLRSVDDRIVPVPVQWIDQLSDFCKTIVTRANRPIVGNPQGLRHMARVLFSRSIPTAAIDPITKRHLPAGVEYSRQDWYPQIWRKTPDHTSGIERPILTASEKTFDVAFTDEETGIRFDSLHPDFAEKYGNSNRWANVVKLNDWGFNNQISTIAPTEYRDPKYRPFRIGGDALLSTTEGFVTFPRFKDIQNYWTLTDGMAAIAKWLKTYKIESALSEAGRATQQIIQTLGGFNGVRNLANREIVELLNEISRRPITKSMKHREFAQRAGNAVKGNVWLSDAANQLIERRAVELGMQLRCPKCSSTNWLSLRQLDYNVSCALCLREFTFPAIDPGKKTEWAYRLIGPFALPDYAHGGYAASLAIRFFSSVVGHRDVRTSWAPGQDLTFQAGIKSEADFILWYQRTKTGLDHPTRVIFGEAKSFGKAGEDVFLDDDVSRMKKLAEAFPGAALVFATMKDGSELSKAEVRRLRTLADWGREYIKDLQRSRAPVIVLTGTELFTGYDLSESWEEKGGRHKELMNVGYMRFEKLGVLAELTQMLYLRMPGYHEDMTRKLAARRRRKIP